MRLPWGNFDEVAQMFLADRPSVLLGCLSFEDRCRAIPIRYQKGGYGLGDIRLIRVRDPKGCVPDHSAQIERLTKKNADTLERQGVQFCPLIERDLLAGEDELIDFVKECLDNAAADTFVLDISTLPKRYFSFMLKRLLRAASVQNLIVTYSQPEQYLKSSEHLASDPEMGDHLPGFPASIESEQQTLVMSIGFEEFNLASVLENFKARKMGNFRILLNFPPNGEYFRRQWRVLVEVMGNDVIGRLEVRRRKEIVNALDVELAFLVLDRWAQAAEGVVFAPFGPKTHSLAMALCAVKWDFGVYYTQPKAYHPEYTKGIGDSWAYVVKWAGTACYDRVTSHV